MLYMVTQSPKPRYSHLKTAVMIVDALSAAEAIRFTKGKAGSIIGDVSECTVPRARPITDGLEIYV